MAPGKQAARKVQLRELSVKKAKPKDKAYLIWDAKQRGLALRIQPTGSRSWVAVYNRHGRTRWLTLGNADAIGLSDARLLTAKAMLAVAQGKDPAAERKAERVGGTFRDLAARYVEMHAKRHNRSWPQAAALVARHALPRWSKLQASAITRGDVKALMARIEAPIVANQTLAAVSAIYSWGVKEEIVTVNPCKLVDRNPTKSRDRVLSDSEIPNFWSAFDDIDPVRAGALRMILITGQRPGEVAHMRREHIVDGWWTMPGEPTPDGWPGTKNAKGHRVWLAQAGQALIAALSDKSTTGSTGFVFGTRGRPVRGLDQAMRDITLKLGVERTTPHDLRRTFGSMVTATGHGRPAMDRILNHADHSISSVYDRHGYSAEDQHIMETVAARIMALVEGRTADAKVIYRQFGGR